LPLDGFGWGLPGWASSAVKTVTGGAKEAGGAVVSGARTVGGAVVSGARTAAGAVAGGVQAAGGAAAGHGRSMLRDVRIGDRGWVTRVGERLARVGVPVAGVLCETGRYRNSGACRTLGKISWDVGKRGLEKAFALPDGSLDHVETILNQAGRDPAARSRAADQIARERKIPRDALEPLVIRTAPPLGWLDQLVAWIQDTIGLNLAR
jgi:hypothetical protein